ncbi:MAG: hypothetical protein ACKPBA_15560 [Planctomycetota bacterium]
MKLAILCIALLAPPPGGSGASDAPPPTAPAATAPAIRGLDTKAFAQELDSLGDVRPVTRTVFRAEGAISAVTFDIGIAGDAITARDAGQGLEIVARAGNGTAVVIGAFRWDAQRLEWSWRRVSASVHRKALDACAAALASAAIDVRTTGGTAVRLQPPVSQVRASLRPGATTRVAAPVPPGRRPLIAVAAGPGWTVEPGEGSTSLVSDAGELVVGWDDAARECTLEWVSATALEAEFLRAEVLQKKKELGARNRSERSIIEQEISALEARIKDIEERAGLGHDPPSVPAITLKSDTGREYAVIKATMRKATP